MNQSSWDLGDPDLEYIDPTPNVHALFVQFNKKYFWRALESVSVRWSKRMFTCAGICRYEGRGGLCDIGLSEPLLKLRPRRDLIETLLHEMIHAYLFLTERDRDRDGHGPNFQKHMHRINKAANLNITIYHSFHDEVRLYKVHVWRCDGPCQRRQPYFGVVRRTCNRAPGPNDFWWRQHQDSCGGKFIKIKEPEKKVKEKKSITNDKENIKKYLPVIPTTSKIVTMVDLTATGNPSKINAVNGVSSRQSTPKTLNDYWSIKSEKSDSHVLHTVRNHWANKGFDSEIAKKRRSSVDIVETPPTKQPRLESTLPNPNAKPAEEFTLEDANAILQDIYGDEFNLDERKYRKIFTPPKPVNNKRQDPEPSTSRIDQHSEIIDCPSCRLKVVMADINDHLDVCTVDPPVKNDTNQSGIRNETERDHPRVKIEPDNSRYAEICVKKEPVKRKLTDTNIKVEVALKFEECPYCKEFVSDLNEHMDVCLVKLPGSVQCPSCEKIVSGSDLNSHLDECLAEKNYDEETVQACYICNKQFSEKSELDSHVSVCSIFKDLPKQLTTVTATVSFSEDDDFGDRATCDATETMHPCPCCMKIVESNMMNDHIDKCLNLV